MIIIYEFCICKCTYSLKFIFDPTSILVVFSRSFEDILSVAKILNCLKHTLTSWGPERWCSDFSFQLLYYKQVSLQSFFSATCFAFLCLLILLFKMACKHSAEMLSHVLSARGLWHTLRRKLSFLDKFRSGMSFSVVVTESHVNDKVMYWLVGKNGTKGLQEALRV